MRVYGPITTERRGGAVTVNFADSGGNAIDHRTIETEAGKSNISLRTGCFCNPGAGEMALGISRVELDVCFTRPGHQERLSLDDFRLCIDGKNSGAVRISIGLVTNFDDVQAFLRFSRSLLDRQFGPSSLRRDNRLMAAQVRIRTHPIGGVATIRYTWRLHLRGRAAAEVCSAMP